MLAYAKLSAPLIHGCRSSISGLQKARQLPKQEQEDAHFVVAVHQAPGGKTHLQLRNTLHRYDHSATPKCTPSARRWPRCHDGTGARDLGTRDMFCCRWPCVANACHAASMQPDQVLSVSARQMIHLVSDPDTHSFTDSRAMDAASL